MAINSLCPARSITNDDPACQKARPESRHARIDHWPSSSGDLKALAHPLDGLTAASKAAGTYPFVQFFATRLSEISRFAQRLSKHAAPTALVWISYPKKTSKLETNLSRDAIREAMSDAGWRAVSIVAIDEVWSALRFRPTARVGSRLRRNPKWAGS